MTHAEREHKTSSGRSHQQESASNPIPASQQTPRRWIFIEADDPIQPAHRDQTAEPVEPPALEAAESQGVRFSENLRLRASLQKQEAVSDPAKSDHHLPEQQEPSLSMEARQSASLTSSQPVEPIPSFEAVTEQAPGEGDHTHKGDRQAEETEAAPGRGVSETVGQESLQVRLISVDEYARFVADKDIVPLAGPGLYERMKKKDEDVRIYGGYIQDRLHIAMICRKTPAWRLFYWMEAPFGPVMLNPMDTRLLVRFIHGIEDLEDSDTLLYLRMESFLEYQKHLPNGQKDPAAFNHEAWRQELEDLHVQPLPLSTGFEPGRQARFAGRIDLARDQSLYNGVPVPQAYMNQRSTLAMRSRKELFGQMAPAMQERVMQAQHSFIRVRLLAENELDLLEDLKGQAAEPFDLTYLDAYGSESAMVLVSLDTEEYVRYMKDGYDEVSMELQQAFAEAKRHPRSSKKQKVLLEAMNRMKVWDQELERVNQLEHSRMAEIPLAAGLFLFNPAETLCLWQASNSAFSHLPGLEAMHWFMLDWSRSRHALRYTLWGLSGHIQPGEEGYESFAFIRDFGGRLAEFAGAYTVPFKPGSTRAYQAYLKSRNLQ